MYKIKQFPEDFVVNELFEFSKTPGIYGVFLLKKTNYSTIKAIQVLSKRTGISLKNFGFAGMKDKNAVTTQHISIKNCRTGIKLMDLETEFIRTQDSPISLGDLEGNRFEIVIRNILKIQEIKDTFVNYYGEQRFSRNNVRIGKAIIKKDWKTALELIDHECVKEHLQKNPADFIGAIKTLPLKLIKLFISAYQSFLWNECVKNMNDDFPEYFSLIGFDTNEGNEIIRNVLELEKIRSRDFIIKQFPQLTLEGGERKVIAEVRDLEISELENDDLNEGMKKIKLKFWLEKGSYATEFIRQMFEDGLLGQKILPVNL